MAEIKATDSQRRSVERFRFIFYLYISPFFRRAIYRPSTGDKREIRHHGRMDGVISRDEISICPLEDKGICLRIGRFAAINQQI